MVSSTTRPADPASTRIQNRVEELAVASAQRVKSEFLQAMGATGSRGQRVWVAYSGGLDSTVLLHLVAKQWPPGQATQHRAIHVNHNVVAESATWAAHCTAQAAQLQIPITLCEVPVGELLGGNLEHRARQARYRLIGAQLAAGDLLLTAHHRRDQAETVLLQLLRGGGVNGTAAMAEVGRQHGLNLLRPLLQLDPELLQGYARHYQLQWIEDPSNQSFKHQRNYLRHQVMPLLRQVWPGVDKVLARSARIHNQSRQLNDDLAAIDLATAQVGFTNHAIAPAAGPLVIVSSRLRCDRLAELSGPRRSNLLRYWLKHQGHPVPTERQLQMLEHSTLFSRADRSPVFTWGRSQVSRYRGELSVQNFLERDSQAVRGWNLTSPLSLGGVGWQLSAHVATTGVRMRWSPEQSLRVAFRQGGETMQLRGHRHKLKKLFQEWAVPPVQRSSIPLVFADHQLVAVPGFAVADPFLAQDNEQGWQLRWQLLPSSDCEPGN